MKRKGSPMSGVDTMDKVIRKAEGFGLFIPESTPSSVCIRGKGVRIGNLLFYASSHDTGCHVDVWVIDGDDALKVRSVPYWYSRNYTFNDSWIIDGPWDPAIDAAMDQMREAIKGCEDRLAEQAQANDQEYARQQAELHARFGKQFATSNP